MNEWIATTFCTTWTSPARGRGPVASPEAFLAASPGGAQFSSDGSAVPSLPLAFRLAFSRRSCANRSLRLLPDTLLDQVENTADFLGVLAFDKWMGNADSRQAIFFERAYWIALARTRLRLGFCGQMVDNGYVLDGPHWRWGDSRYRACISAAGLSGGTWSGRIRAVLDRIRKFSGRGCGSST